MRTQLGGVVWGPIVELTSEVGKETVPRGGSSFKGHA